MHENTEPLFILLYIHFLSVKDFCTLDPALSTFVAFVLSSKDHLQNALYPTVRSQFGTIVTIYSYSVSIQQDYKL